MTGRKPGEDRVSRTAVYAITTLTNLERVCQEEGVIMPTKVRASIAHLRVWLRDVGRQHRH